MVEKVNNYFYFMHTSFKDRLLEARTRAGMTQAEAAKRLGTTQQAYAKYEAGVSLPGLEKLYGFCELFNVSADWLLGLGSDVGVRLENSHHNAVNSAHARIDGPSCRDCPWLGRVLDLLERLPAGNVGR